MDNKIDEHLKKGTTTVGILCKNGVVIAADKRVSSGYMVSSKTFDKVHKIDDSMAVSIAGLVSDAQLIVKLIQAEIRLKKIRSGINASVKETANMLSNILYSNIRKFSTVPGIVSFLLGGMDEEGAKLYELGVDGSLIQVERFTSTGSGSVFALGALENLFEENLTVDQGIKIATKALTTAIGRDMATGDGIDVIAITEKGAEKVVSKRITQIISE